MVAAARCALVVSAGPLAAGSQGAARGDEKNKETMAVDANSRVISGMLTDSKPGKWLVIRTEKNGNESFKLDEGDVKADIDARVAVGSRVMVTERVDGGARTLTVAPA
jgi:hypothetical protein